MSDHIVLTSHPRRDAGAMPIHWGAATAAERGPVVASLTNPAHRNVIGTHSGAYAVYRALAVASGALQRDHRPDLTNTAPAEAIGPHPQWDDPDKIVSLDPWGHLVVDGVRRPHRRRASTCVRRIAITKAHINMPELKDAIAAGRLKPDGRILLAERRRARHQGGDRSGLVPAGHRAALRRQGKRAAPRAVRADRRHVSRARHAPRPQGLPAADRRHDALLLRRRRELGKPETRVACRVHDECNGSDVFGSDICTCRPYLAHGIEVCIEMAQQGGVGLVVYNRKEGRALGEVTKFLVYNARKRQVGRRPRRDLFRAHRVRGRRAGHALPGADARRLPLARRSRASTAGPR